MAARQQSTACSGQHTLTYLQKIWSSRHSTPDHGRLPATSAERLASTSLEKTVLYLAYGSNLSAETFRGFRGIKPISALNVQVPSLTLTFDVLGLPYTEPCFANSRYSSPRHSPGSSDYHKDRWHKGLIGVVYEVTPEDYRTIIATEGGGSSYHDVVVPCYAIPPGTKTIHHVPAGTPFSAHTLLQPRPSREEKQESKADDVIVRPDPSYAQASARYLNLITSGGDEHELPEEYMAYLYSLRPYTITTYRQRVGQALVIAVWMPIILFILALSKVLADGEGKMPDWLAQIMGLLMKSIWLSYDRVLKRNFGDGERTIGDGEGGKGDWDEQKQWGSAV